jgi:predicted nucleic acid-binding protein
MMRVVVLDATPLGLIAHPKPNALAMACSNWVASLEAAGHRIIIPEITDYEIRRELLRAGKINGLLRLDQLQSRFSYLPLTTLAMRTAAELWATARRHGFQTASNRSLDADVILAAQAITIGDPTTVIATSNPMHLGRFTIASDWTLITP